MRSKRSRLDQFIAQKLQISKKAVRQLLIDNRIELDDKICKEVDKQINEFSRIRLDETWLQHRSSQYYMLNKPVGVVSATIDDIHPTALSLLKDVDPELMHIAGRLDLNSTGLLLITNDSQWSQALMAPETKVDKQYLVTLANPIDESYIKAFADGMYFGYEDITTKPAKFELVSKFQARVTLQEGKYHQIKRMFGRFRNPVVALHRESIGGIILDNNLDAGEYRHLTEWEVHTMRKLQAYPFMGT
ncbi:pseudouridine synthase [Shewanella olleyana]|uniref:16S rRNA pseudouridine(516) synthase n=1 Tax=Shewanella olleyana TaxID=135626 RepID=UPI00200F899E|nr:16S rRNA pseudouridine(516) synthase [Shewanella olleyana]MCL1067174.1 pseudouridine synthase [Shewanella olleyana]